MSTIKTLVNVHSSDFFKGYLENWEDPVYHALAEMHDSIVSRAAEPVDKDKTLQDLKFLINILLTQRKHESTPIEIKIGDVIKIKAINSRVESTIAQYGDMVKVLKIGEKAVCVCNIDCIDIEDDSFKWGSWLEFGSFTVERIVNV